MENLHQLLTILNKAFSEQSVYESSIVGCMYAYLLIVVMGFVLKKTLGWVFFRKRAFEDCFIDGLQSKLRDHFTLHHKYSSDDGNYGVLWIK